MSCNTSFILFLLLIAFIAVSAKQEKYVRIKTRKLSSERDVSYKYYSMPVCQPENIYQNFEPLAEYLFGDIIQNSIYNFEKLKNIGCKKIEEGAKILGSDDNKITCPKVTAKDLYKLNHLLDDNYNAEMLVDSLPIPNHQPSQCGAVLNVDEFKEEEIYTQAEGFPIGCIAENKKTNTRRYFLNNHLSFTFKYNIDKNGNTNIIGAHVTPSSIDWEGDLKCTEDSSLPSDPKLFEISDQQVGKPIPYSYSVRWEAVEQTISSRWDPYLKVSRSGSSIQWFSLFYSISLTLILTALIAMNMVRILHRDIKLLNDEEEEKEFAREELGIKSVAHDVFRKPVLSSVLSLCAGAGVQLICMVLVTALFVIIGFVSTIYRTRVLQVMIVAMLFMGIPGGYTTGRIYRFFDGQRFKGIMFLQTTAFPLVCFFFFSLVNLCLGYVDSSNYIPFLHILIFFFAWVFINMPLIFLGGYLGFNSTPLEKTVEVNQTPGIVPPQSLWARWTVMVPIGGLFPFITIFIQAFIMIRSIWGHRYYYIFGLFFVSVFFYFILVAEFSIICTYYQLSSKNYHWWWRSFIVGGAPALFLYAYSIFNYFQLHVDSLLYTAVYFEYMTLICFGIFLMSGSVGLFVSLYFVIELYKRIRVD